MSYFGLTGGIACGKSTVAAMLGELGARIIDADQVGHTLLASSESAFREIVQHFGREVLDANGEIDRRRLGATAFADPGRLRELNAILHPRIIERTEDMARRSTAEDPSAVVVIDAALIFEAGIAGHFRKVIVAWCRSEQQLERLMRKPGMSHEEAERRIAAQMPADEKRRRADYVIDCSGSLEATRAQVAALYPKLQRLVRSSGRNE